MSILITGGASQIGTAIAHILKDTNEKVIFGTRSGLVPAGFESPLNAKLDWADESTLNNPFVSGAAPIKAVYILIPAGLVGGYDNVKQFVDLAVAHGVKRFVLMSGTAVQKDGDWDNAKVWRYLEQQKLDYFVLRPTVFIDNFYQFHRKSIIEDNEFLTVMPDARVPMVSAADIASFAAEVLINEKNVGTDRVLIGPEMITYDQAAEILSEVLGRKITHRVVAPDVLGEYFVKEFGWAPQFAQIFLYLQANTLNKGSEERWWNAPDRVLSKESLREWAERFKGKLSA